MPPASPVAAVATVLVLFAAACGSSDEPWSDTSPVDTTASVSSVAPEQGTTVGTASTVTAATVTAATEPADTTSTFQVDVWADNWMAVYVDGELIGEDSVPITTERSFNAESFVFEASGSFTIAIEAKDFMETDSGLEYIGERNQQMGDGGLIAQITDLATGEVVAVTDSAWSALVVHQAPLDIDCVDDPDPDSSCEFLVLDTPDEWAAASFDDSGWSPATEWSESAVSPKDGYDTVDWDVSARLVWGTDLEVDNTVLLRFEIGGTT